MDLVFPLPAVPFGNPPRRHAEQHAGDDAGHNAAYKKFADGHVGNNAIENKGIAGRNHDADGAGAGDDGRGEGLGITARHHGGNGDHADGGASGDAGTGNGPEEGTGDNRGHGQTAGTSADHHVGQADELSRKAALAHEDAGQNKEKYGQHRK